jgi:hypothetical protein
MGSSPGLRVHYNVQSHFFAALVATGQTRPFADVRSTSGLPQQADLYASSPLRHIEPTHSPALDA